MISIEGLKVEFGVTPLFEDVSFVINKKDRIALVGKNGAGKSTMLKILAGLQQPTEGNVAVQRGVTIGYLPQVMILSDTRTVMAEAEMAFEHIFELQDKLAKMNQELADRTDYDSESYHELIDRFTHDNERFLMMGGTNYRAEIERTLVGLGFSRSDFDRPTSEFSGGWRMRIELAKLLLRRPDVLLLDEPTNHLDAESVAWLEQHLKDYSGTVVMVTHDRYFLDNVTGWILELDRGQGIPYEGNYSSWLEQKQKRLEQESREETSRQRTLANELEWIRKNPKARQAKSKARINAYEELLAESGKEKITQAHISIPMTDRLGDLVVEANGISKGYGDRLLIDNLSFKVPKGAIVGIIGPNGAGKTTLFRMITGQEKPDAGEIRIGETVDLGYVDQSREELDPNKTVWEEISDGLDIIELGKKQMPSRAYVGQFNFKGTDQQKKVGQLSGGERNRVHLAKMLRKGANVILLDEPTNDLDVDTLRSLEEGIMEYPGCVFVTSHDRWFLDRLATHILAYEGDSQVVWFEGNFEEYEKDKRRRLGDEAVQPHRVRYKKLA